MSIEKSTKIQSKLQKIVPQVESITSALMEKVLLEGDMTPLSSKERLSYIATVCKSLGLNPLTRPFEYIKFQGKLTLYARKEATEQLRHIYKVSTNKLEVNQIGDLYNVIAYMKTPDGREDCSTGVVYIKGLTGDALANACMKAETKAKRRGTLSMCGLSILDESEIEFIPGKKIYYDTEKENRLIEGIENCKDIESLKLIYKEASEYCKETENLELKNKINDLTNNKKNELTNNIKINKDEVAN